MESLFRFVTMPAPCNYLPEQRASLEYEIAGSISAAEYLQRMIDGWRRFGHTLFHPVCASCSACQSVRVYADSYCPNRSQRRAGQMNEARVRMEIGRPSVTDEKLRLYDRYHRYQAAAIGWPDHGTKDVEAYVDSFVNQPFPVEEWCYYVGARLVGVGYVDAIAGNAPTLPGGLSAIYFYYDPDEKSYSLGTWNVMRVIEETARRGLPFAYLGYYVAGCRSLAYKGNFLPNQLRHLDGVWRDFCKPRENHVQRK